MQALDIPIFSSDVRPERSRVVLALAGELDCATVPSPESALDELLAAGWDDVVLDLARVAFIDSTGLVAILAADRRAQQDGWRFTVAGRCSALDRLLAVTGLTGVPVPEHGFERAVGARAAQERARPLRVLDADPDLGASLPPKRVRAARQELLARGFRIDAGSWRDSLLERLAGRGVGLLVMDGVLTRELVMSDNVTTELIGTGDVIATAGSANPSRLLQSDVRWSVLEPARVAVLGPGFMAAVARYPEVNSALIGRLVDRSHRLAVAQAISQLNGVDRRILTLLWHLAERWVRITTDGVVVPLVLPHRLIAQLVGARRPTVSTALRLLSDRGHVSRLPDGTWLPHGDPVGLPTADASRVIRLRKPRADLSGLAAST